MNKHVREYLQRKVGITLPPEPVEPVVTAEEPSAAEQTANRIEERVLPAIDRYLQNLPSSSWGMHFSIDKPEGRERASAYILNVMRGVSKEMR